jgi:putative phage-type endonuclease
MKYHLYKVRNAGNARDEVKKDRDKYIGGSDVGAIMGVNPWKSAYTLWAEKTGAIQVEDIDDNEAVWWGNAEEDLVAHRFTMKTGKKVKHSNYTYFIKEVPYFRAHVDRLVYGENSGLECKTTSAFNRTDFENGEIPPYHYWQCMFYMLMTGATKWYLATKRDNRQFYMNVIERDEDAIAMMLEQCADFWRHVESGEPPEADGSSSTTDTINEMYPEGYTGEIVDLSKAASELNALEQIKASQHELDELADKYRNTIKSIMGDAERGETDQYIVTWKTNKKGTRMFKTIKRAEVMEGDK